MCGIIGYSSKKKDAKDVVIAGLKNLEYRGYDSAGIATTNENGKIMLYKAKGKIANLEEKLETEKILSSTAIGHTRWATHGEPSETNAHPHKVGITTLVHNGIIENYIDLKEFLMNKGISFKSSTDTEVACAYINYMYEKTNKKSKLDAIIKSCDNFRGSYAFAIIFDDEPNTIYATRKDSPLIIGLSENGNFAASDVSAILDFTNKYILLEKDEFAKITCDNVEIYDKNLQKIDKEIKEATWSATEYKKNSYEHFMLKEINEQPKIVERILKNYLENEDELNVNFENYDNIHIVACGSAMHAGMVGKYLFENFASIPVTVEIASEYRYKRTFITPKTLVIIISQSGETADSLAALRIAKEHGAKVLSIVNAVGSSIARESDKTIYTYAGPEIAVATTKGYTSQVAILTLLCLDAMKQKNILTDEIKESFKEDTKIILNTLELLITNNSKYLEIAKKIMNKEHLFFLGRGIDYALSLEGSLKLKEISYMHSEAYAAGELKHGTISLIEDDTPVIAIATDDMLKEKTISNIKETKARGSFVIFITNDDKSVESYKDFADITLTIPKLNKILEPLVTIIPLQLIAYETAKLRGCDIDKPKNLAKSVTVE